MRIEIQSTDRIGISQEILSIFSKKLWDIKAVEIGSCVTYIHINEENLPLAMIKSSLSWISGIKKCQLIDLLPSERNAKHLETLLARIPDPIIDIDHQGMVLAVNYAANSLLTNKQKPFVGRNFSDHINIDIVKYLSRETKSVEIDFLGTTYIADINPVLNNVELSGAVIVLRTINTLGRQVALLQKTSDQSIDNILGQSAQISQLKKQVTRFAELDLPVLITGETGTGKELFARALHEQSSRSKAPFLAINCAALPENLLESELFGYASGAFSGAKRGGKPGLFELANGGTVFLDEIAEMSIYLQAKILRFLQDFTYRRVGGNKELKVDVRIVSATHQNLLELVQQKLFREDLFYRINVLALNLPPLRERIEDVQILVQSFINEASLQTNRTNIELTASALQTLQNYNWPGNIRQLQNILFSVIALTTENIITAKEITSVLTQQHNSEANISEVKDVEQTIDWATAQNKFEKQLLQQFYPLYPTTRKLAERLHVSHNKIAMKLRQYNFKQNNKITK